METNPNRTVRLEDVDHIVNQLDNGFGDDNRTSLDRQLHRVSAIRDRDYAVIGLTLRAGRHISGLAAIVSEILFEDYSKSIMVLGEPGAGKTSFIREMTRLLADRFNVCLIDTSNEIAGTGPIPHKCIGFARRLMVPSLKQQSASMIECVQNHAPEVMVLDEIGRRSEADAAMTCKNRGVRMIASAHGNLRSLVENPELSGTIGGTQNVILGDVNAVRTTSGALRKVVAKSGLALLHLMSLLRFNVAATTTAK